MTRWHHFQRSAYWLGSSYSLCSSCSPCSYSVGVLHLHLRWGPLGRSDPVNPAWPLGWDRSSRGTQQRQPPSLPPGAPFIVTLTPWQLGPALLLLLLWEEDSHSCRHNLEGLIETIVHEPGTWNPDDLELSMWSLCSQRAHSFIWIAPQRDPNVSLSLYQYTGLTLNSYL